MRSPGVRPLPGALVAVTALLATACGDPAPAVHRESASPDPAPRASQPSGGQPDAVAALTHKLKFKGDTPFELKPKDDGAKLVDADEAELARYSLKGDKLKIKDADDAVLGYVTGTPAKLKLKDASQQTTRYILQRQADGDYKLENGAEEMLAKIKVRDYGYEIEKPDGGEIAKVKVKDGKTSLRDAADRTLLSTRDPVRAVAVAPLAFADLALPERVAFLLRLQIAGN